MVKEKPKIEREKINYPQALFRLCDEINKKCVRISHADINGLRGILRGIKTLEVMLSPYLADDYEELVVIGLNVSKLDSWETIFNNAMMKYGELYKLMDDNNLLMKESTKEEWT